MSQIVRPVRVIQTGVTNFGENVKLLGAQGHFSKDANVRAARTGLLPEIINAQSFKLTDQPVPEILVTGNRAVTGPAWLQALRGTCENQLLSHGETRRFVKPCSLRETNRVRRTTRSKA